MSGSCHITVLGWQQEYRHTFRLTDAMASPSLTIRIFGGAVTQHPEEQKASHVEGKPSTVYFTEKQLLSPIAS